MPIPLPNLDDRTYADLAAEAHGLIPTLEPTWTDHNPSDPGITLVELLAWLTEMLIFRVNEIPDAHTVTFLKLLNGPGWTPPDVLDGDAVNRAVRDTMRALNERYRAVTPDDYEYLLRELWPGSDAAQSLRDAELRRVRCVPQRDLTAADPTAEAPAHVSVIVVPAPAPDDDHPQPTGDLIQALMTFLGPHRLLTTRHHVVGPDYVEVAVTADLALQADAPPDVALAAARDRLAAFLHPLRGGPDGTGWPFGRDVHVSEVYAALDRIPLVDYVEAVQLTGPPLITDDAGRPSGVALDPHQLVRLGAVALTGYDVYGEPHLASWPSTTGAAS